MSGWLSSFLLFQTQHIFVLLKSTRPFFFLFLKRTTIRFYFQPLSFEGQDHMGIWSLFLAGSVAVHFFSFPTVFISSTLPVSYFFFKGRIFFSFSFAKKKKKTGWKLFILMHPPMQLLPEVLIMRTWPNYGTDARWGQGSEFRML